MLGNCPTIHVGEAHELLQRVIQQVRLEGLSNIFYQNSVVCFREQKPFVLKTVFFSLGLGIREGVNEGSRHGSGWVTFSSISCRHSSKIMYFLECVYVESLHVHLGGE